MLVQKSIKLQQRICSCCSYISSKAKSEWSMWMHFRKRKGCNKDGDVCDSAWACLSEWTLYVSCEESCGRTHIKWTHKGVFRIERDVSSEMAMMDRRGIELLSSNFSSVLVVIVQDSSIARGRQRIGRRKIPKQGHDGCGLEGGGHFRVIYSQLKLKTWPHVQWLSGLV